MIGQFESRPPIVRFERQAHHDAAASLEAGRHVTRNVDVVHISQPPGKDWTTKNAEKWLKQIKEELLQGRRTAYPPEWVDGYNRAYENWLAGVEGKCPEGETPLREVPFVSPAEAENYANLYIYSIEAAAAMTEDTLKAAGMGARQFRDKCRAFLDAASGAGKTAEEIASLKRQLEIKDQMIQTMEARLSALEADKPRRGRPPKEDA